ncbi:MAG: SPFH domain-containing protein [Candidatus Omnitrophota bacterium]|nr:MAG: SPFH domain-containing protein [Candidatus Omnitrophota bacterium]
MNEKEEFMKMMHNVKMDPKKMGMLIKLFFQGFLVFIVISIFLGNFLFYVGANEFAIKQVNIGINSGVRNKIYNTGLHLIAPFGIHQMHKFPKDMQVFEMNDYLETQAKNIQFKLSKSILQDYSRLAGEKQGGVSPRKSAHIQTSDGFFVDVDVSILYHITDPYKLITTIGPGRLYEDNGIMPKVEPVLKETLGEMTTEEFYKSNLRGIKAENAKNLLNVELNPKGMTVDHVLVRYFKYSDEIQKNIEEKKLKDQLVFTNRAKAKAATQNALVQKVKEEGEAKIKIRLEEGKAYAVKRNSEKDLYVRTKHAQADLMIKLAEANKKELINNAYQNKGSDKLVGLKMADVLKGINVLILPTGGKTGFNPLNLNRNLDLFGISSGGSY